MSVPVIVIYVAAALFAFMELVSIVAPTLITAQFGIHKLDREGRNEVRAVYGGFGVAMAGVLIAAVLIPDIRAGVTLTVGLALGGMAVGRVLSAVMDHGIARQPVFYLILELFGFTLLLGASGLF
jgi:hypothetical protein